MSGACLATFTGDDAMTCCEATQTGDFAVVGDSLGRVMAFEIKSMKS
jgi:hypothetical protein